MRPPRTGTIAVLVVFSSTFIFAAQPAYTRRRHPTWGQILISGGRDDNTIDLYDPASNRFVPEIAMPRMKRRVGATATVLVSGPNAGKVLLAGGDNRNGIARASTELYDPASNTVMLGPPMHIPRKGQIAAVIAHGPHAGMILIAGGRDAGNYRLSSTELYDPEGNTFSPGPAMGVTCDYCPATMIPSGKKSERLLIAGCYDSDGQTALLEIYDPAANKFIAGPRTNMLRVYSATAIPSGKSAGKVLIIGAIDTASQKIMPRTGFYDPDANIFSPGPAAKNIRNGHTAIVITSGPYAGRILIAGGGNWVDDSPTLASTELFDPDSNAFSPGPSMNTARARHSAMAILSGKNAGKILIAGGFETDGRGGLVEHSSTELYDPVSNKFAPPGDTPIMNGMRSDPVAIQLPPAP
jgi:Kelch motif